MEENPTQIQWAPENQRPPPTRLVLIHDGGGTTFGYHILDSLDRDVYGIHNPHFYTAEPWEGGMDEMARHYIELLKKAGIRGPIFLGGWSLGGFLSVAMARILAEDDSANISVAGILIIDSPFHIPLSKLSVETAQASLPDLPDLVRKSLDNCVGLLRDWALPEWDAPAYSGQDIQINITRTSHRRKEDVSIATGHVFYKPLQGEATVISIAKKPEPTETFQPETSTGRAHVLPPAVLLRCVKHAPSSDSSKPARVDIFRDKMMLGWDENYPEFIKAVIDVDSNHYNIFEFSKVEAVTKKINEGLEILESVKARMA